MKIRKSFVANSSSSSFICEICGAGDVYNDGISLSDIDMFSCVNGHLLCDEHKLNDDEPENEYEYPESSCPICQMQCYSIPEIVPYLKKVYGVPWQDVFAVIKQANKRRKKLYNEEYIKYVFDKFDLTEDILLAQLREKFKTYKEFSEWRYNNED